MNAIETELVINREAVVIESSKIEECLRFLAENRERVQGVVISRHRGFTHNSVDFLSEIPWIKQLVLVDDLGDLSVVSKLENLELLQVANAENIDFSGLKNLKSYSGKWPSINNSFYKAIELEFLSVRDGPSQAELENLGCFNKLSSLSIAQSPIETLSGVDSLESLENLGVHYCRYLHSIKSLGRLKNLKTIHFQNCKKIDDINTLVALKKLLVLNLENCGDVRDLNFISSLPLLSKLLFYGTSVVSCDLNPVLKCRALTVLGFNNKKLYTHTLKELEEILMLDKVSC